MLRDLPPNPARLSYTVTENPRSTSSCAALRPPTPPPSTATEADTEKKLFAPAALRQQHPRAGWLELDGDPVEHRGARKRLQDELVGEHVAVRPGVLAGDAQAHAGEVVTPPVRDRDD